MNEPSDRREFLKRTGAGLAGMTALGAAGTSALLASAEARRAEVGLIPPHRELRLPGLHGYADRESVAAGEVIRFAISSSEPYRLSVVRLGLDADGPGRDEILHRFGRSEARVQPIHPGSCVVVHKGLEAREELRALTLECWVRPFRVDGWSGLLGQHDYPDACGFGLFNTPGGTVAFYLGSGGTYEEAGRHGAGRLETGRWHHVVGTWDGTRKRLYVDGREAGQWPFAGPVRAGSAPLRLAAYGEHGVTARFLDGDLAMTAIYGRALNAEEVAARQAQRGLGRATGADVLACWSFAEERGDVVHDVSGSDRSGRIIHRATWMVGGPSFDANVARFGDYDPTRDEKRGHGLRFAADDLYDCRWDPMHEFRLPETARPGVYVARAEYDLEGKPHVYHIAFIVRRRTESPKAPILLLAATNTWRAYSSTPFAAPQPGLRHVAGTGGLENSPGDPPAYSFYRAHAAGQGTYQVGLRVPWPLAGPYIRYGDASDYSHLARAERFAQIWLERSGYAYDVATDLDLHREPELLRGYKVLFINGHSEYWSLPALEGVDRYLKGGGNVVCLSGNTMFWRVSLDEVEGVLECRKVDAPGNQMPPSRRGECWHSQDGRRGGLLAECGFPGWKLVGLSTLGWNNHGDPEHFSPFIVEDPDHFLFHKPVEVGVEQGEPIGQAPGGGMPRANGHEVDVRLSTLQSILEKPAPDGARHPQDPVGMVLLAAGKGWPRDAPKFDYFMRPVSPERPLGGEVIYWERPEGGRVFNAGSIGAGRTLLADEKFAALVANALDHFGVPRPA